MPLHVDYDEAAYLRLLQGWLEQRGLALSYAARSAALAARRQLRSRSRRVARERRQDACLSETELAGSFEGLERRTNAP